MIQGEKDAPILCVMDSPPSEGMEAWFWKKLAGWGIKKTDVCIVTILDEEPENKGGKLSASQKERGWDQLDEAMEVCRPRVVVPFGPDALYMLTGFKIDIYDARGYLIPPSLRGVATRTVRRAYDTYKRENKAKGIKVGDPKYKNMQDPTPGALPSSFRGFVIPTFKLDTIRLESFSIQPAFAADMKRAQRAADGKLKIIDDSFEFYPDFCSMFRADGELIDDFRGGDDYTSPILAVDIETHGVDNEVIDRVSCSDGVRSHTLVWSKPVLEWLQRQMDHAETLIFHNGPFDIPRLTAAGMNIDEKKVFDTMMASVTLQPDLHKGLGRAASVYFDLYPWKWDSIKGADEEKYSAKDAYVTALLYLEEAKNLKSLNMWSLFTGENYEWGPGVMMTMPVLTQATADGLKIDRVEAKRWAMDELEPLLLEKEQEWARAFPGMNPHSTHEMKRLMYGEWKLPIVKTKEDGITVDEYAIIKTREYIKTEYARTRDESPWKKDERCTPDVFDLILKIRETAKLLSTYAVPAFENEGAYVHPQYLPVSKDAENFAGLVGKGNTATGRLASSRPNIQNQPKKARRLYIPDRPDWSFVQFDYSRAELWSMCAMAKDDVMRGDLESGDPYIQLANSIGIIRDNAKNVLLAGQYLAGGPKVSEMILRQQHKYISPGECKKILTGIAERYWKVAGYKQYLIDLCKTRKYIVNPFGRVRIFYNGNSAAEAVNFIPQSIVADILWSVLREVALIARRLGGRFTTTVHDSILLQIAHERVAELVHLVQAAMTRTFDCVAPGFRLPVSVEVADPGMSWGHMKEYKVACSTILSRAQDAEDARWGPKVAEEE